MHRPSWRPGGESEGDWRRTLGTYAVPRLGQMQVDRITSADVMAVLQPIWSVKAVTAGRVRQRIGAVMRWAIAQGYRADNPAGDAITAALPRNGRQSRHFKALPHGEVATALATVRESSCTAGVRLSLEFLVLTAVRSGEVRGARWDEVDVEAAIWRVPGSRTKTGREHRVPLSRRALEVLEEGAGGDRRRGPDLPVAAYPSPAAGHGGVARAVGRDWESTRPCTGSAVRSGTGAGKPACRARWRRRVSLTRSATRRRQRTPGPICLERRREVMEAWAEYCAPSSPDA